MQMKAIYFLKNVIILTVHQQGFIGGGKTWPPIWGAGGMFQDFGKLTALRLILVVLAPMPILVSAKLEVLTIN